MSSSPASHASEPRRPSVVRILRTAAVGAGPRFIVYWLVAAVGWALPVGVAHANQQTALGHAFPGAFFLFGAWAVGVSVAHAFIVRGVVAQLQGRVESTADLARATAFRMPVILGVFIPCALAGMLGALLLLVPALWLCAVLLPLAGVVMIEGRAPLASVWRTTDLTLGHRLVTLGALAAFLVIAFSSLCVMSSCVVGLSASDANVGPLGTMTFVLNFATSSLLIVAVSAVAGAAYCELLHVEAASPPPRTF